MNVRSIRGPNWVEASVSVTIMTENTTPTTVMSDPASDDRICLAASGDPLITQVGRLISPREAALSMLSVAANSSTAAALSMAGMNQRFVRSVSLRQSDSTANRLRPVPIACLRHGRCAADQTSRLTRTKNIRRRDSAALKASRGKAGDPRSGEHECRPGHHEDQIRCPSLPAVDKDVERVSGVVPDEHALARAQRRLLPGRGRSELLRDAPVRQRVLQRDASLLIG